MASIAPMAYNFLMESPLAVAQSAGQFQAGFRGRVRPDSSADISLTKTFCLRWSQEAHRVAARRALHSQ